MLFYLGLDMWIFSVGNSEGKMTKHHKKADAPPPPTPITQKIQFGNPPPLLDLINRHSLAIFLLVKKTFFLPFGLNVLFNLNNIDLLFFKKANVLTGLINLTIPTMYTSDVWAMIILVLYSITLCGVPRFVTSFWRTRQ
jgi:glucosaminylphosphatidylinositol acyltransferase